MRDQFEDGKIASRQYLCCTRMSQKIIILFLFFLPILYLLPWHSLQGAQPSSFSQPEAWRSVPSAYTFRSGNGNSISHTAILHSDIASIPGLVSYHEIRRSNISFNPSGSDVLVILHIQKTGGTSFEKHIVQDLQIDQPCVCGKRRKRCKCPRPSKLNLNGWSFTCIVVIVFKDVLLPCRRSEWEFIRNIQSEYGTMAVQQIFYRLGLWAPCGLD